MQSARNAATAIAGDLPVHVVDSRSITSGLGTQVRARRARPPPSGASADEVVALVEDLVRRTHVIGALDTLDNLKKGGRIGGAQALLGSLLSIKPILDISTGRGRGGRPRPAPAARPSTPCATGSSSTARSRTSSVTPRLRPRRRRDGRPPRSRPATTATRSRVGHIGPVIGAHGGPRVMGVTWLDPA